MHVDKRISGGQRLPPLPTRSSDDKDIDKDEQLRLKEQRESDDDDGFSFEPAGQEEQDWKLVNDFP